VEITAGLVSWPLERREDKMVKSFIATVLLMLVISNATGAETWQDKVSYEIPHDWELLNSKETDSLILKLYLIKERTINSQQQYYNALLQYYTIPSDITMEHADNIVASHTKSATYILSAGDGPNWKTYLLTYYERNEMNIVLYRLGMVDGVCVELMFSFPVGGKKGESDLNVLTLNQEYVKDSQMAGIYCQKKDVEEMVKLFNTFCEKMKLCGKNQYRADARLLKPPKDAQVYRHIENN
jgi:hypothetical protein